MAAPEKVFKAGNCEVAIFKNKIEGSRGSFDSYSIKARKTYKQDDEFKTTDSFQPQELPKVILLMQEAYRHVILK